MKKLIGIIVKLALSAALIYFLYAKVEVRVYRALGTSMDSTIYNGELLLSVKAKNIQRGDIVVFNTEGSPSIKRVIGLPKEKIEIKNNGNIYIEDKLFKENYISSKTNIGELTYPHTIDDNSYYVLGDNRLDSYDSRFTKIKDINKSRIRGKIVFSISRFKLIKKMKY